jgi:hypothetical protein
MFCQKAQKLSKRCQKVVFKLLKSFQKSFQKVVQFLKIGCKKTKILKRVGGGGGGEEEEEYLQFLDQVRTTLSPLVKKKLNKLLITSVLQLGSGRTPASSNVYESLGACTAGIYYF